MEENKKHPRILVVDDAPENLMVMESILSKDYSLKLFNDSSEALEYAFANPPDLILLDVMMPKIDGFEICRRLKANPKLSDVPVIFITSKTDRICLGQPFHKTLIFTPAGFGNQGHY